MRNCALPYLEEESPEVRQAAALTCCKLFDRDPICYQASNHSIEIVSDVLDKLLTVGIADPGAIGMTSDPSGSLTFPRRAQDSSGHLIDLTREIRQALGPSRKRPVVVHRIER